MGGILSSSYEGTTKPQGPAPTAPKTLEEKEIAAYQLLVEINRGRANDSLEGPVIPIDNQEHAHVGEYQPQQVPRDEHGFAVSFTADQAEEIVAFYEEHGFVVIRSILTEEEARRSEAEVWDFLERNYEIDRNRPETWERWTSLKHLGILGDLPFLSPQFCLNRQNPRAHQAFAALFKTEDLLVSVDRASMMRPTVGVRLSSGEVVDKPDWKTRSEWLHWDMNPWTGKVSSYAFADADPKENYGYRMNVQGILALVDCAEEDGGFHAVPGFHKYLRSWAHANKALFVPQDHGTTFQVPAEDPIRKHAQPIPLRKGSLLIWDSCLPHGTYPNNSSHGRAIQYLKMFPRSNRSIKSWLPRELLPLPKETETGAAGEGDDDRAVFRLTPLGEKLYGFA